MKQALLLLLPVVVFMAATSGQATMHRVMVANGGAYADPDDYVTLTAYHPETGETETLTTIFSQSVQGMLIDGGYAWIAAQDSLAKINLDNGAREAVIALSGVNKFAIWQDKLLVSRQYPVTENFLQVRDAQNLELITQFTEISDESWEIAIAADTAYVSVAGGWAATVGKLAVIDLETMSFVREINLGEQAVGIGPSYVENDRLIIVCKTPWGGTTGTLIDYHLPSASYSLHEIPHPVAECAGIHQGKIYLQISGNIGTVYTDNFSVADESLVQNPFSDLEITAMTIDSIHEQLYVNYSYWVAPDGTGRIYDLSGNETGSYQVGIAAEEVAVDYRDVTGMEAVQVFEKIQVLPNPCMDLIQIRASGPSGSLQLVDVSGRQRMCIENRNGKDQFTADVSGLPAGIYFILPEGSGAKFSPVKIIKN
ncbi:MAG: T9SS type A sorting domain-containing protein [Bacteroidales bacterium]